jgi:hypothetical protein
LSVLPAPDAISRHRRYDDLDGSNSLHIQHFHGVPFGRCSCLLCRARHGKPLTPVSLWKNEGKNRSARIVKGGLDAFDRLYDSKQKLTGFPPCLTVKI